MSASTNLSSKESSFEVVTDDTQESTTVPSGASDELIKSVRLALHGCAVFRSVHFRAE